MPKAKQGRAAARAGEGRHLDCVAVAAPELLRLLEHVHGHVGWLAVAVLIHPAVLLRERRAELQAGLHRRATAAVSLGVAGVMLAAAGGLLLYPRYRVDVRPALFARWPAFGMLFERKEHLAIGAVFFSWAGAAAYFSAGAIRGDARQELRRAAHWGFVAAAIFAMIAASFGTVVASCATFGAGP